MTDEDRSIDVTDPNGGLFHSKGETLHVRSATPADQHAIIALVRRVLPEFELPYDPSGADSDVQDIETSYMKAGGSFEVITNEAGEVIGTAGLLRLNDRSGRLRKMYLDPAYRGRGLGAMLLRRAIDFAERSGLERIELDTVQNMTAAILLYEAHGFVRASGGILSPRCDVFMEKVLSNDR